MTAIGRIIGAALAALIIGCDQVQHEEAPVPASGQPTSSLPTEVRRATATQAPTEAPAVASPGAERLPPTPTHATPTTSAVGRGVEPATQTAPTTTPPLMQTLQLEPVFDGLRLNSPTNMIQSKNGPVWVSEQVGRVWVSSGPRWDESELTEALDISDRVSSRGSEEGLLGLALDPDDERRMYVYYSAARPRRSVISRFDVDPVQGIIDAASEAVILEVEQPYANHNGGQLAFGPDGYLYIGLGDGGSAGDPQGHGQDVSTLLGSILRIDVSESTETHPYAIPADNPLVGKGGRGEIWAYGLRNPWRFSFDSESGQLWAGDVGQNRWEEIDLIEPGANYGWNVLEGNHCFRNGGGCDSEGLVPPVWEYSLDGPPCSVIGGHVYRGAAIPWLYGVYVYGDFCSGEVFGLRYDGDNVVDHQLLADTDLRIMSFGRDKDGELFVLSQKSGVFRLTSR